jgi:hypothetical protein
MEFYGTSWRGHATRTGRPYKSAGSGLIDQKKEWEEARVKSLTSGRARRGDQAVGYFLGLADRFYLTFTYFLNLCGPTSAA